MKRIIRQCANSRNLKVCNFIANTPVIVYIVMFCKKTCRPESLKCVIFCKLSSNVYSDVLFKQVVRSAIILSVV